MTDFNSDRAAELSQAESILSSLDQTHLTLKKRLAEVLTREATDMISLGS
ncbi:hypothetical protein NX02_21480 [Sphingomonas sanxanigenens DSM 19645 = NX02]|uniref:Uncharacterized protein n=1 Tax=Sphingomonas sanxanigenens DSM 19645 = NX02 TaxID=1123269 RepID=W0AI05_9SPHN|nr:hypothetical protein NX02_21480 [Sphingomonas sanxanigenens DSM 19645 = NX02]